MLASPLCCDRPRVDETWGWEGWWDGRSEHSGGDPGSELVNVKRLFTLSARASKRTNREHQER